MILTKSEPLSDSQKIIIGSLAMDLKRVAIGMQRGSTGMANRFKEEALQRGEELEKFKPNSYILKLISGARETLLSKDPEAYEDTLMYSTLLQNFAQKK